LSWTFSPSVAQPVWNLRMLREWFCTSSELAEGLSAWVSTLLSVQTSPHVHYSVGSGGCLSHVWSHTLTEFF
jgi:hypothetical protein